MKFRKKPVVIDAFQMTEKNYYDSSIWPDWLLEAWDNDILYTAPVGLVIDTLEGDMSVGWNDWIIRGVQGEIYPCKPDIFEMTYEKAEE